MDIGLTKSLEVCNFGNREGIKVDNVPNCLNVDVGFAKCLKFDVDFRNGGRNAENIFHFLGNSIGIGNHELSLLERKNLSSAVNVLKNSLKVSNITNRNIFQLNSPQSNEKIW